jgi:hypothetical protein
MEVFCGCATRRKLLRLWDKHSDWCGRYVSRPSILGKMLLRPEEAVHKARQIIHPCWSRCSDGIHFFLLLRNGDERRPMEMERSKGDIGRMVWLVGTSAFQECYCFALGTLSQGDHEFGGSVGCNFAGPGAATITWPCGPEILSLPKTPSGRKPLEIGMTPGLRCESGIGRSQWQVVG